ncbi:MAG: histidinol-phosphate transaminase [Candidatus Promineifilaceae bacterium]
MSNSRNSWVRPDIAAMDAYTPIQPFEVLSERLGREVEEITKLDANENPYGPSPAALQAIADERWFHIYPDPEAGALRRALATYQDFPVERLMAGMGADELIDLVLRALLSPGEMVINCPPSFGMYPFSTDVNMGLIISVPRRADFSLDVEAVKTAVESNPLAKVLFVCSPNNPDGSLVSDADLLSLLELPLLVVLDEAYVEFAQAGGHQSRLKWALEHDNLVVLRTFSKLAGLAGLRVGYGAFPEWLLPHLWKIKQPYNVNVAASCAAIASLQEPSWMQEKVRLLVAERERMARVLAQYDFLRPYPSQSNFVLFEVWGRSARQLKEDLAAAGILVRYFDKPGLNNCIRISAGRPQDTDRLIAALSRLA